MLRVLLIWVPLTGHSKWFRLSDLLDYEHCEFHGMRGLSMLHIRKVSTDFGQKCYCILESAKLTEMPYIRDYITRSSFKITVREC